MSRFLAMLASLVISVLAFGLLNTSQIGTPLGRHVLRTSHGGDPKKARCKAYCDEISGNVVGCAKNGEYCQGCGTRDPNTGDVSQAYAYTTGNVGPPCEPTGGKLLGVGVQSCGNILTGTCLINPNDPVRAWCIISQDTGIVCAYDNIVASQAGQGGGDPGENPDDPGGGGP